MTREQLLSISRRVSSIALAVAAIALLLQLAPIIGAQGGGL